MIAVDLFTNTPQGDGSTGTSSARLKRPITDQPLQVPGGASLRKSPGQPESIDDPRLADGPPISSNEPSAEQAAGSRGTAVREAATRTPPAPAAGTEEEFPDAPLEPITDEQWARILKGRKVRWLVNMDPEQLAWASKRAVSCGSCTHTTMSGDPRRGWCTENRFMVSMAFLVLCRAFEAAS